MHNDTNVRLARLVKKIDHEKKIMAKFDNTPKIKKCNHEEFEEYKGKNFCKKCGDDLSGELCLAPGCMRYKKTRGKICEG